MAGRANKPWVAGRAGILPAVLLSLWISGPALFAISDKPGKRRSDPERRAADEDQKEPALAAWEAILRQGTVDQLFDPAILPGPTRPQFDSTSTPVSSQTSVIQTEPHR